MRVQRTVLYTDEMTALRVFLLALTTARAPAAPASASLAVTPADNRSFTYDANGRLLTAAGYWGSGSYVYDALGNIRTRAANFAYDGNFKRVKEVRSAKIRYTIYSRVTGGLIYRDELTDAKKTCYVSAGGAGLRLKKTGAGVTPEGSAVAATDAGGVRRENDLQDRFLIRLTLWRESYTTRFAYPENSTISRNSVRSIL